MVLQSRQSRSSSHFTPRLTGLEFNILRIGNPYGSYQLRGVPVGSIARFIKMRAALKKVEIWGSGSVVRDYLYIDDFCSALTQIVRHPAFPSGEYNLASGSGHSLLQRTCAQSLGERGIRYQHFPELDGRRKTRKDSRNTTWRNESFRSYAHYLEPEKFCNGVERLVGLANKAGPAAIMCAEAISWRCHRALISDYLKARGFDVMHIRNLAKTESHPLTSAVRGERRA